MVVVIGIIAILAALILPAIMRARVAARRIQCGSRLHQMGVALQMYADDQEALPWGRSPGNLYPASGGFSAHAMLLPYLEQQPLFNAIDFRFTPSEPANWTAIGTRVDVFLCPADRDLPPEKLSNVPTAWTNYAANRGRGYPRWFATLPSTDSSNDGPFLLSIFKTQQTRLADIRDGHGFTAAFSERVKGRSGETDRLGSVFAMPEPLAVLPANREKYAQICRQVRPTPSLGSKGHGWLLSWPTSTLYDHFLQPNQPSCANGIGLTEGAQTASSRHPGGVNVVLMDASTRFISEKIELNTWRALGTRAGGEVVGKF
jgi:type II secretory pathway pseudopilin PulG